ncbi:hypothetical protein ACFL6U_04640 [Planctomycetota bacterium]
MKARAITVVCVMLAVTGCSGGWKKAKTGLTKTFYGRTIKYQMETSAKEDMTKLENLMGQAHKVDPPVPDELLVPIYRDADIDRNHFISTDEAEIYYNDFILKFEDSLGSVKYRAQNN